MIDGHLYGSSIDILRNGSTVMLLAIGMTLVIATGGVDLSVGAVMAISASVAAILINPDFQAIAHDPTSPGPAAGRDRRDARRRHDLWPLERRPCRVRRHPADGRDADPDDRRPRHRPAHHERRSDSDLLRAVRLSRQRLDHRSGLAVRRGSRLRRRAGSSPAGRPRDVHRVRRDQCAIELLQRRQREAREAVRLHVLWVLRRDCGARRELEHPDVGRQQHRAELRARCDPRGRHRWNRARWAAGASRSWPASSAPW